MTSLKIYTLTPNPVLDLGGRVEKINPNEKNYIFDPTRSAGGNAINVARLLTRLGHSPVATGFIGGGIGDEIKQLLEEEGIFEQFIPIQDQSRINVTVSQNHSHYQTRLSFPGPKVRPAERKNMHRYISQLRTPALLVVGGTFPPGFSEQDLFRILKVCRRKGIPAIVDCPAPLLEKAIFHRPLMIKPNLTEFQEIVGRKMHSVSAVLKECRMILPFVPLICVSSVAGGAVLVTKSGSWFGKTPNIKPKSVVGAGDSMVAAMVSCLAQDRIDLMSVQRFDEYLQIQGGQILKWGLAAACATLSHEGTALGSRREIEMFFRSTSVNRIEDGKGHDRKDN